MKSKARQYSTFTIKRLYALSGNICAFPDCQKEFFQEDNTEHLSNICHIEGAKPNSERYNPNMTDMQRASFENLILLCPNHHIITNDTSIYSVEVLKEMKRNHEAKQLSANKSLVKHPSVFISVINILGSTLFEEKESEIVEPPNPSKKIAYNNIIRYKSIIEEYRVYQGKLTTAFVEIEKEGSMKKEFLLQNIWNLYQKEKRKFLDFATLQKNSDTIIDNIKNELWKKLNDRNQGIDESLPVEAIEMCILIILVDSFIRCKILEKPQ